MNRNAESEGKNIQAGHDDSFANVPKELKELPQWVVHKDKIPHNPQTGYRAKAGQPRTWARYEEAINALSSDKYSGLGFELHNNGIIGIDIDHCVNPATGQVSEAAQKIVDMLNSYTEYSPSGTGLHIFVCGDIPTDGRKDTKSGIEIYKASRYLTVTGSIYGDVKPLAKKVNEIHELYNRYFSDQADELAAFGDDDNDWLNDTIIHQASESANGELFKKLFAGNWEDYSSQSEADLALCDILAYWTGGSPGQMDEIFQMSGLMRDKWNKRRGNITYGEMTIKKALSQKPVPTQPAGALKTISAQDLQSENIPPIKWIVKDLIPQGLTMIVAPPKSGKSWLMLDLCLSVAVGGRFLGKVTVKSDCLYLALEDSKRRLKVRMMKLLTFEEQAPGGFDYSLDISPLGMGFQEQIEEYIRTHKDIGLIIVDTVQRIRVMTNSKNAYAQDYAEFTMLKKIADKHDIGVILVHHTKKGKDETDPFMQISGTNGLLGVVDTALVLERKKRADSQATLYITGRDVESPDLVLEFNKEECRWVVLGSSEQMEEQKYHDENEILIKTIKNLIGTECQWQGTVQEIYDAGFFDEDVRTIGKKLKELEPLLLKKYGIAHTYRRTNGKNIHRFEYYLLI